MLDFWICQLCQANFLASNQSMPRFDNRIPKSPGNPAVCFIIRLSCFFQPFIYMGHIGIPCCLVGASRLVRGFHPRQPLDIYINFQAFSASDFSRSRACSRVKPQRMKKLRLPGVISFAQMLKSSSFSGGEVTQKKIVKTS